MYEIYLINSSECCYVHPPYELHKFALYWYTSSAGVSMKTLNSYSEGVDQISCLWARDCQWMSIAYVEQQPMHLGGQLPSSLPSAAARVLNDEAIKFNFAWLA